MLHPVPVGVRAGGAKLEGRVNRQHSLGVLPCQTGVAFGSIVPLHVSVAHLVAQRPKLYVVRLGKATLDAKLSVGRILVTVAVFHPGGALLGCIPSGVDGDVRLGSHLTAERDKIIGVDLVEVIAQRMGLGLEIHAGLKGCALVHRKQTVEPVVLARKVTTRPAQNLDAHFLDAGHDLFPHAVEIIGVHEGHRADLHNTRILEGDPQISVHIPLGQGQKRAVAYPTALLGDRPVCLRKDLPSPSVCERGGQRHIRIRPSHHGHFVGLPGHQCHLMLPHTAKCPRRGIHDPLRVAFVPAVHVVMLPIVVGV